MKRLLVLSFLSISLAFSQNSQGQNGNNGAPTSSNVRRVAVPEGASFEIPIFIAAIGLWYVYRRRSKKLASDDTVN